MVKKLASIFSRRKPQRGSGVAYNNSIIKFAEAPNPSSSHEGLSVELIF
jgi:hypothetical protein